MTPFKTRELGLGAIAYPNEHHVRGLGVRIRMTGASRRHTASDIPLL